MKGGGGYQGPTSQDPGITIPRTVLHAERQKFLSKTADKGVQVFHKVVLKSFVTHLETNFSATRCKGESQNEDAGLPFKVLNLGN